MKSTGIPKPKAFLPHKGGLSLLREQGMNEVRIWDVYSCIESKRAAGGSRMRIVVRARLQPKDIVDPLFIFHQKAECFSWGRHWDVPGWLDSKEDQMILARRLWQIASEDIVRKP